MGMFDMIIADFECPNCKHKVLKEDMEKAAEDMDTWQTKVTICNLNVYKIGDNLEFEELKMKEGWIEIHNLCPNCDKLIEAEIKVEDFKLTNEVVYLS